MTDYHVDGNATYKFFRDSSLLDSGDFNATSEDEALIRCKTMATDYFKNLYSKPSTSESVAYAEARHLVDSTIAEGENPKELLRRASVVNRKAILCFKNYLFLYSMPRGNPPVMLGALHALQSKECDLERNVFTVLDLEQGYAFHQEAQRCTPSSFQTWRMWKSQANVDSSPPWELLVRRIR